MESSAAVETVTFESLDADADGAISQDEAQGNPALSALWEEVDTNKDGQLDEAEFSAVEITGGSEGGAE
jgi:Ca2+-binding EF-hand superfamily protein